MAHFTRNNLNDANLIVVKVGSSSLLDDSGKLSALNIRKIAGESRNYHKADAQQLLDKLLKK